MSQVDQLLARATTKAMRGLAGDVEALIEEAYACAHYDINPRVEEIRSIAHPKAYERNLEHALRLAEVEPQAALDHLNVARRSAHYAANRSREHDVWTASYASRMNLLLGEAEQVVGNDPGRAASYLDDVKRLEEEAGFGAEGFDRVARMIPD